MIGTLVALTILWIAVASRIWSLAHARGYAKIAYTISLAFVAISFTLRAFSGWFDQITGIPNLGDLIWHLALVVGGAASLLYIRATHRGGDRRFTVAAVAIVIVTGVSMIALWIISAPVHLVHATDLIGAYVRAGTPGVTAVVIFEAFLVCWTVAIAWFSWKSLPDVRGVPALVLALGLTFIGACLAAFAAVVSALRALWDNSDPAGQQRLFHLNALCSYGAAVLVGTGVSLPTIIRYLRALRELRQLVPLRDEARLRVSADFRPRVILVELLSPSRALTDVRIDIRDSLALLHATGAVVRSCATSDDPPYVAGQAIADAENWSLETSFGRSVRYVLPYVNGEREDLDQLLRIALGLQNARSRKCLAV